MIASVNNALEATWAKILSFFARSRTVLMARIYTIGGALVAVVDYAMPWVTGQDWTPIFARLFHKIPDDLRPLVISAAIVATGELFVYMRKISPGFLPHDDPPAPPVV